MLLVLLLAALLRVHGLVWTLPYYFHPDEMRLVQNGLSILETGQQGNSEFFDDGGNYPPLRAWEVGALRVFLVGLFGEQGVQTDSLVVLFGRLMSLLFALLTCVFLFHLGRAISGRGMVGVLAAACFAVWPEVMLFGQRILADGAGLMFFSLAAWLSVRAYQTQSTGVLGAAFLAAILAGLGKYNYFPGLLMPGLVLALLALRLPRRPLVVGGGAALLIILPLAGLFIQTQQINLNEYYYLYLDERSMLEGELRWLFGNGYNNDDSNVAPVYWRYPITREVRLLTNFQTLHAMLPPYLLPLALLGAGWMLLRPPPGVGRVGLWLVVAGGGLPLLGFSIFRVVEGRQMFQVAVPIFLLSALALMMIARVSRPAAVALALVILGPLALSAWQTNGDYARPDSRVATVEWFRENARPGTGIAVERVPEEFWRVHGFAGERFNAQRVRSIFEREPIDWENNGVYYLVADDSEAERQGFFSENWPQDFREDWLSQVEIIARFEEGYAGPERVLMRVFRPQVIADVPFGQVARLHGYDIEQNEAALRVKYFWQAEQPNGADYIIFNHLVHLDTGEAVLTEDRLAGHSGVHPSSRWEPHEWLFDHFELTLPPDAPAGRYQWLMGLYRADDGTRLPIPGHPDNALPLLEFEFSG